MRVLVTDGEHRAALAVVRSLGQRGHDVYVCSSHPRPIAAVSRYCRSDMSVPNALASPGEYVIALRQLCCGWGIEALLPITEPSIMAVLPAREQFTGVRMPLPSLDLFMALSNKAHLMRIAPEYKLNVPRQMEIESRADLEMMTASESDIVFPVVIKPARSVGAQPDRRDVFEVKYANDMEQLTANLGQLPSSGYPVLLQQRVQGPGFGVTVLMWDGVAHAVFAHRRLREKPPSGGVSVYCESVAADPELIARVVELLRRHQWSGVAMAEFKEDAATRTPYLMEVNARFWGSLQLAIDSGVDFPAMLLDCLDGRCARSTVGYRPGVRLRWWWGDVDQLLIRMLKPRARLNLPAGFPGRWQAVREFVRPGRSTDRSEVFRWSDPRPGIAETINWLRRQ